MNHPDPETRRPGQPPASWTQTVTPIADIVDDPPPPVGAPVFDVQSVARVAMHNGRIDLAKVTLPGGNLAGRIEVRVRRRVAAALATRQQIATLIAALTDLDRELAAHEGAPRP